MDMPSGMGGGIGPAMVFDGGPVEAGVSCGGGGGGEGGGSSGAFAFYPGDEEEQARIGPGGVIFGRTYVYVAGASVTADGYYWVKATLPDLESRLPGSAEIVVTGASFATTRPPESGGVSWFPLYHIEDGAVSADYRSGFVVPMWEK